MPIFDPPPFDEQRQKMVKTQIVARDISDQRVLDAFLEIPRHEFVPKSHQSHAYQDRPLAIGLNQTISQPFIVAYMTEQLAVKETDKVLEVGTGSGYQAAILSRLAAQVHTIERHPELLDNARKTFKNIGITNIQCHSGDGSKGLVEHAPYDVIIVTAAAPETPQPLLDQLADGGRLIIPVGQRRRQSLQLWKRNENKLIMSRILQVAFVPLRGQFGWQEVDWH